MGVARPVDLDPHQAISVSLLLVLFVTLGACLRLLVMGLLRGWEAGAQGIAALDIGVRTLGLTALIGLGLTVLAFVPLLSFPLLLVALVLLLTPVIGAIVALLAVAPSVASLLDQPYLAARSAHVAGRLAFFVVVPSLAAFVLHWDGGPLTC
jgi:hypothetical protein